MGNLDFLEKKPRKKNLFITCSSATATNGIWQSENGLDFSKCTISPDPDRALSLSILKYLNGVCFCGDGPNGSSLKGLYYSEDGTNFIQTSLNNTAIYDIVYAKKESLYIAATKAGIYYSKDGKAWSQTNITSEVRSLATNENIIICGGSSNILYSEDGILWKESSGVVSGGLNRIAFFNNIFVSLRGHVSKDGIYYSHDGKTWSQTNITSGSFYECVYFNEKFIASGYSENGIYYSEDGITWTKTNAANYNYKTFGIGNGIIVVGKLNSNGVSVSSDGITWADKYLIPQASSYLSVNSILYVDGVWYVTSNSSTYFSSDLDNWTKITSPSSCGDMVYAKINLGPLTKIKYSGKGFTSPKEYYSKLSNSIEADDYYTIWIDNTVIEAASGKEDDYNAICIPGDWNSKADIQLDEKLAKLLKAMSYNKVSAIVKYAEAVSKKTPENLGQIKTQQYITAWTVNKNQLNVYYGNDIIFRQTYDVEEHAKWYAKYFSSTP